MIPAEQAERSRSTTTIERLETELAVRKRQIGLMGNCLSRIQNSPIVPEPIRIAATAALVGASEFAKEIANGR
jgi:hypothetical protein